MSVATARDAANLLEPLFAGLARERLAVLYFDRDGRRLALDRHECASDEHMAVVLPIRAIIARALEIDCSALVVAHNHPGGDPKPSAADIAATRRLVLACEALEILLHDHLIFAGGECESFRRLGLL